MRCRNWRSEHAIVSPGLALRAVISLASLCSFSRSFCVVSRTYSFECPHLHDIGVICDQVSVRVFVSLAALRGFCRSLADSVVGAALRCVRFVSPKITTMRCSNRSMRDSLLAQAPLLPQYGPEGYCS